MELLLSAASVGLGQAASGEAASAGRETLVIVTFFSRVSKPLPGAPGPSVRAERLRLQPRRALKQPVTLAWASPQGRCSRERGAEDTGGRGASGRFGRRQVLLVKRINAKQVHTSFPSYVYT